MDFDAAVERLKAEPISAGTALLLDDEMLRVAVVWPRVRRTVIAPEEAYGDFDPWDLVIFSPMEVMQLAGLPPSRFPRVFPKMRQFGFLYPDGTVAKEIRGIINQKLAAKYGQRQP